MEIIIHNRVSVHKVASICDIIAHDAVNIGSCRHYLPVIAGHGCTRRIRHCGFFVSQLGIGHLGRKLIFIAVRAGYSAGTAIAARRQIRITDCRFLIDRLRNGVRYGSAHSRRFTVAVSGLIVPRRCVGCCCAVRPNCTGLVVAAIVSIRPCLLYSIGTRFICCLVFVSTTNS